MTGRHIISKRKLVGVDQADLKDALGLLNGTLCDIENDKLQLSKAEYRRILQKITELAAQKQEAA